MITMRKFVAFALVLMIAISVFVMPASAAEFHVHDARAARICYYCGSDNLSYRERVYTPMGLNDDGYMVYYIEDKYACGDCGNFTYFYVGSTARPVN